MAIETNDTSNLVKNAEYNAKVVEIEEKISGSHKYSTTLKFSKSAIEKFNEILKRSKLAANNDFNAVEKRAIKN